jgi:peptide/nickel transport system permease protein
MSSYIIRRFIISIPLLLAMTFVTFLFIQIAPGNFFDTLKLNPQISEETIQRYESQYSLDKPILIQYINWLKGILRLDLGYSFFYNAPVIKIIKSRLLNTLLLTVSSLIFTWMVALPLGIWAAIKQNRFIDRALSLLSFIGLSSPSFFLALIFLYLATYLKILPLGGMRSVGFDDFSLPLKIIDIFKHLIIPVIVISVAGIASLQRIMRSSLLETLRKQYIITARAKGLSPRRILYIHALRNAINPLVTIFGYQFSSILSGAALVEIICNWPGLGQVMLVAVRAQDLFLVMASALMGGVMLITGNLLADILLAWLDPRIRYE